MGCSSSRNLNRSVELDRSRQVRRRDVGELLPTSILRNQRSTAIQFGNLNNITQQYQQNGGGDGEDAESELRQLQTDLETLERLFQTLVGRSFTAQLARNLDAVNANPPYPDECPPASFQAIDNLTCIEVSEDDLVDECNRECCICFFQHDIGDHVVRLPCGHLFHRPCITEWLNKKCTCPICRYELPTDHETYEIQRIERMSSRRMRLRPHELKRMSIVELQELTGTEESDHDRLVHLLRNSDKVDILPSAPGQRRPEEDELNGEENTPQEHPLGDRDCPRGLDGGSTGEEEEEEDQLNDEEHTPQDHPLGDRDCPRGVNDGSTGEEEKEETQSTIEETPAFANSMVASN
eukprot:CAMPEP_0197236846 /NCGR_PEP_ID=MMETSP1429-20130617/3831_1 /TAXON_ID=49237 /ORGANISM="Chaetoceros  sp., Strain UNC1202" /LENGTH=350 /DNA_ID=CAMNT_0042695725 /DNA_START=29 /DNA_END=1081 /DNA_ORIENTATION=-